MVFYSWTQYYNKLLSLLCSMERWTNLCYLTKQFSALPAPPCPHSGVYFVFCCTQGNIRSQHQSQSRRINDLMRNFEETRYRIDRINHRSYKGYGGSDLASDSSSERRGSTQSLDKGERSGSVRDHRSRSKRADDSLNDRSDYRSRADYDMWMRIEHFFGCRLSFTGFYLSNTRRTIS